jgi:[acyl-carrier-protein] S-malonyltransferase
MSPARDRLRKALSEVDLRNASRPVFANIDATAHREGEAWAGLLGAQHTSPVLWRQSLHNLASAGANVFIELGPGTVLTGMAKRTVKGSRTISIGAPSEVDALLETLAGGADSAGAVEGETLYAAERLVVSPSTGVFQPQVDLTDGTPIERGQVIGAVNSTEVRSPFAGSLQGMLALAGERVTASQPLAWLRTNALGGV